MAIVLPGSKVLPTVITSFHKSGYEKYGKAFIESWKKYWSPNIRLVVYYEGESEEFELTEGITWRPIEEVEFLQDFMDAIRPFPIMSGIVGDRYDINFDARMARKSFMQAHTARKYGGKVFWIDADSETYKNVPEGFLDDCLPDDKFSCFLGRDGWYFTESGFIGFNSNHPIAKEFFRNYLHLFITGVIFTQQWWHDCIAYDCTRIVAYKQGFEGEFVNLAAHVPPKTMHPFENSAPGKYMHHYKGDRKETRELKEGDVIVRDA